MSGGVDSSVAAVLLQERGVECIGVNMHLYDNEQIGLSRSRTCCSLQDVEDAKRVAYKFGMRFFVFNFSEDFQKTVIDRFIKTYEQGGTPNPCIDCNRFMKFEKLYERAKIMECDKVVTGHYARIEQRADGRWLLKKSRNAAKDQSYVLYFLSQDQLAHTLFPLGEFESKEEVRALAEKYGLINAEKPDSQDICFVPDGDYAAFIERVTGRHPEEGNFVTKDGRVLGRHKGIISYTVGQRKGLGLALPHPGYVCEKRVDTNEVVVGEKKDMLVSSLLVADTNWIAWETPPEAFRAAVRTRYHGPELPATVTPLVGGGADVTFDAPQPRAAAGQAAVFYDGDIVLGGGKIL